MYIKDLLIRWIKQHKQPVHLRVGSWGERVAICFLNRQGYKLLQKNVRIGRNGELDAVMQYEKTLIFVEVKTRKNEEFGRPFSAINRAKRKKVNEATLGYIKKNHIKPTYIRFDVVEVIGNPKQRTKPIIRHIQNAWTWPEGVHLWW